MTIEELFSSEAPFVYCDDVSGILKVSTFNLHSQAVDNQSRLGFPTTIVGNKVLIPRIPFLRYFGYEV